MVVHPWTNRVISFFGRHLGFLFFPFAVSPVTLPAIVIP